MTASRAALSLLALVTLSGLTATLPARAGTTCAPLQERMSYVQFRQLGLDKLSDTQLKGLNSWLQAHGLCGQSMEQQTTAAPSTAPKHPSAPSGTIHSRIDGDFSGWEQGTVFTLKNGQRWRVTEDDPLHIATLHDPKVTVWRGIFNAWLMSVDGMSQTTHVMPAD